MYDEADSEVGKAYLGIFWSSLILASFGAVRGVFFRLWETCAKWTRGMGVKEAVAASGFWF